MTDNKPITKSLDIGCGGGEFKTMFRGAVNIDISRPDHKGPFILSDAHKLPFKKNIFTLVTMYDVIEHLENPTQTLKEIRRVLKPGCMAIIGTPNAMRILNTLYLIRHGFYIPHKGHIITFGRMELENLIRTVFPKNKVFPRTYLDNKHAFIPTIFLKLPWKDLTERQLIAVVKK